MMKYLLNSSTHFFKAVFFLIITASIFFTSCDKYEYDDQEPDWLGASIYEYLETEGNYSIYVRMIKELGYDTILSKTGSKTIFVADDEAFNVFFQQNEWGVKKYDDLSRAQKSLILNFSMINNAYLIDMLANYNNGGFREGQAFRRQTAVDILDSVPFEKGEFLPGNKYWDKFRQKGVFLLKDNTPLTLMYFTRKHMLQAPVTNEDFVMLTGNQRDENDAHIFNVKIKTKDIKCKNGYVHVMEKVLVPPVNMAEYINRSNTSTTFSKILDRFCIPVVDMTNTVKYRDLMSRLYQKSFDDTIYVKKYLSRIGGTTSYPTGNNPPSDLLLPFDPGWNSYIRFSSGNALQSDMAAMFVPTDEAMNNYFTSGSGAVLRDRFKTWDSVPMDILPLFIKRHMRTSFMESLPSRFSTMVDEDNSLLQVKKSDIARVYIGSNGVVYETNEVYPPDDYVSVYGPVLLSANNASPDNKTKIWKWAILQNDFRLYLNSLVSKYSFFVPTDEYFKNYIDPVSVGKDVTTALRYWYNERTNAVNATLYRFDKTTQVTGDSIGYITNASFLVDRLLDLLDYHIVVGDVESGRNFYLTKGNVALNISGKGSDLKVRAGGNIQLGETVNTNKAYSQMNGKTYFIDRPIQAPTRSVYKVLSETPEFSDFFSLMIGFPSTSKSVIFVSKSNYFGIDFNVKFFNTFNYTVYVPTNDAIQQAIKNGIIKPWDSQGAIVGINQMTDPVEQAAEMVKLERFVRYHFQDNSVFVDNYNQNKLYQSATMKLDNEVTNFGTFKNKYYKIGIVGENGKLTLVTEKGENANIVTSGGLYNILTRDYVFNLKPSSFLNPDGTGTGTTFQNSSIITSSSAVIHQINKVLNFQ